MKEYLLELCKEGKDRKIIIVDAAGIFASIPLQITAPCITSPRVINEIKDKESMRNLKIALENKRLIIIEPPHDIVKIIESHSRKMGEHYSLSQTDKEVIALAQYAKLSGCNPLVYTDDYAIQNILRSLGINYVPIKTRGISKERKYIIICRACGWIAPKGFKHDTCPICGTKLSKKITSF